jgi:alpha-beta hydrolase superfamily lysophospholipase
VYFLDRRGSGLNEQDRGDTPGFRRLLSDAAEFLQQSRQEAPQLKTFVVGISWGGKVVVAVEKFQPGLMDAVALLCPGFHPRVSLSLRDRGRVVWARLTNPKRLFPIPLSDPARVTATEKWLMFLREDPLTLHEATARFLFSSVALDIYLRNAAQRMRPPVLMLLAGQDRIIDNVKTRTLVDRFAGPHEIIDYPEAHHTLEFEPDPDRHVQDLVQWFQRCGG